METSSDSIVSRPRPRSAIPVPMRSLPGSPFQASGLFETTGSRIGDCLSQSSPSATRSASFSRRTCSGSSAPRLVVRASFGIVKTLSQFATQSRASPRSPRGISVGSPECGRHCDHGHVAESQDRAISGDDHGGVVLRGSGVVDIAAVQSGSKREPRFEYAAELRDTIKELWRELTALAEARKARRTPTGRGVHRR